MIVLVTSIGCHSTQEENIEKMIDQKLESIVANSSVAASSNPYDYIKDNKDYEYIIAQGDRALQYLLQRFKETSENGLKEYIMAMACSEILGENQENKTWSSGREWYEHYISGNKESDIGVDIKGEIVDVYIAALDSFMPLDEGLNGGMKYIAIDTNTLKHLPANDKQELLKYFEKYHVEVMDASLEKLKEMGLFDEKTLSLDGILLRVQKMEILSQKKAVIEGSKYRSGIGAIGVKCVIEYKDGEWKVKKADITWIS